MIISSMNRMVVTPPEGRGVKVIGDYFRSVGRWRIPEEDYRLRFLVSVPMTARLHRSVGGEVGLEVGRVSEGSLDVALNILNYYVPPGTDGREMRRVEVNFVSATAYELHREFCERYLAPMDPEKGAISDEEILGFVEKRSRSLRGPELVFDRKAQRERGPKPGEAPVILDLSDEDECWYEDEKDRDEDGTEDDEP